MHVPSISFIGGVYVNQLKWIGYAVGYVFITSGVMKLLDADFQTTFIHLGLPFPYALLFLVALTEVACGMLIIGNMYVKQASMALIVIMAGAIYFTKVPVLSAQGILSFAFEARLDVVMLVLLLLLWKR
jgi:uncharacterized membrane protein YphA (DoxX/SURF4 family)